MAPFVLLVVLIKTSILVLSTKPINNNPGTQRRVSKRFDSVLEVAAEPEFYDSLIQNFGLSTSELDDLIEEAEAHYQAKGGKRTRAGVKKWVTSCVANRASRVKAARQPSGAVVPRAYQAGREEARKAIAKLQAGMSGGSR